MQNHPQIITKIYDFILYLVPQISKFPKSQRYLIGDRIESCSFEVLELLIEAWYSQNKIPLLNQVNIKLEKMRYYVRLSKDLKLISLHRYEVISEKINEIGIQLGGWIKQQRAKR